MSQSNTPLPSPTIPGVPYGEKQAILLTLRRQVMAAMETGNSSVAKTIILELREHDFTAANKLAADVVKAYGTDPLA